jgi:hypothetical protein
MRRMEVDSRERLEIIRSAIGGLCAQQRAPKTYPRFGSPNCERVIHCHVVTLQDERLLLISTVSPGSASRPVQEG